MNRTLAIILLCVFGGAIIAMLIVLFTMLNNQNIDYSNQDAVENARKKFIIQDKYAGREKDAIKIVREYMVQKPEYIDALMERQKSGKAVDVEAGLVSIDSLVESQLLEHRFGMNFLKKAEWRALHLDTDMGSEDQKADPWYEVYLDYQDEDVIVGPVWIVDLRTNQVVPRNAMASVFDRNIYNYNAIEEALNRPAGVIHAISAHQFEKGMNFGGVLLLHFLEIAKQANHSQDEIIGWTVMHEFENEYSAYFQWKELGETHVAKFIFDWETKRLEPRGLDAIHLMQLGEEQESVKEINILPQDYTNNLGIPRNERWIKGHACRTSALKDLCTAFVKVLEQQEFISALSWLITAGQADASIRVEKCKSNKRCKWVPKVAGKDHNPEDKAELIEISYIYDDPNGQSQSVNFLVNSKDETVTPLDKFSRWAYFAVTPRS